MTQRAILIYHSAVLDSNFVFVMVMYGVMSAIAGFLFAILILKIRKELHERSEAPTVFASVLISLPGNIFRIVLLLFSADL